MDACMFSFPNRSKVPFHNNLKMHTLAVCGHQSRVPTFAEPWKLKARNILALPARPDGLVKTCTIAILKPLESRAKELV